MLIKKIDYWIYKSTDSFNEDGHFDLDVENYHFKVAVELYSSSGYFDYRMDGEPYEDGYQSIPLDWGIHPPRKKAFLES